MIFFNELSVLHFCHNFSWTVFAILIFALKHPFWDAFRPDIHLLHTICQCFGSGFEFNWAIGSEPGLWIRTRIQAGQNRHKKREKMKKFHVWRALCRAGDFSWSLNLFCRCLEKFVTVFWSTNIFKSKYVTVCQKNLGPIRSGSGSGLDPDSATG